MPIRKHTVSNTKPHKPITHLDNKTSTCPPSSTLHHPKSRIIGSTDPSPRPIQPQFTPEQIATLPPNFSSRLESLEALLRNVPPAVQTAMINQVDAATASGPVSIPILQLPRLHGLGTTPTFAMPDGNVAGSSHSNSHGFQFEQSPLGNSPSDTNGYNSYSLNRLDSTYPGNKLGMSREAFMKTEEESGNSISDLERTLKGLNLSNGYLYLDEIGQTKWQGESLISIITGTKR